MAKTFYAVLTNYGAQQFAQAIANKSAVNVTHFAVGDGNGKAITPSKTRTALFREVHRNTVSNIAINASNNKQVEFELTLPENVGGFTIREMGIFDANNKMLAHANTPESYKPTLAEGSGKIQVLRMIVTLESSDAVTLTVDNSAIWATRGQVTPKKLTANTTNNVYNDGHTHEIAKASTSQLGIVKLNNSLTSTSTTEALTAAQGKKLAEQIANVSAASADGKVSKTGDTVTGYLNIKMTNGYSGINQYNDAGKHTRIETIPDSVDHIGFYKISQRTDSEEIHSVSFPKSGKNKIVAYQDWATAEINQVKTIATTAQTAANTAQSTANAKWTAVDATTGRKGIVQLSSATNSTAENLAATPKAVKDAYSLASVAASNAATAQSTANGKWTAVDATTGRKGIVQLSSATNSTAENLAATTKAVKTAYDLAVTANTTASGKWTAVDASTTAKGIVQLNNTLTSTSTTQALTAAQGKKLQGEKAPINNPTFTGTISGNYRLVIDRNEAEYSPYINIKDSSVDVSTAVSKVKTVGDIHTLVKNGTSEWTTSILRTNIQTDKNATGHYGVTDSAGNIRWAWSAFGKTANVAIAKTTDDGINRLQVNGTATVSAPAANANNAQVPTTAWVHQQNYFKSTSGTLTGNLAINSGNDYSALSQYNTANKYSRVETLPDSNTNFYKISYWNESGAETDAAFFPKSGKQKIVAYQDWTNAEINKVKTIATTAQSTANAKWTAEDASTARKGIVQLNSAISSASEAMAATSLAVKTAYDRASTAISTANSKSTVAVLTGEIRHGGTIPLPSGFTQAQCKWFVSIKNSNPNNSLWDIKESGSWEHFRLECYADNNRKVTAIQYRHDEGRDTTHKMTANYIIIGVK